MATDVITTIGATSSPTTPDYSTLQAWEDDLPADLVAADERHIGECLDQGEFLVSGLGASALSIAGQTTDSTRYIILRCATGASFRDKAGVRTTALAYNASNGVAIRASQAYNSSCIGCSTNYTRFHGLQVKAEFGGNGFSGGSNLTIEDCIVDAVRAAVEANATVVNCLLVGHGHVTYAVVRANTLNITLYGCTVIQLGDIGSAAVLYRLYASLTAKNCALFGGTAVTSDGGGAGAFSITYSATDDTAPSGTGNVGDLVFADQFENSASDFRAVSTGDLQAGTPDSTNTPDDITGLARDATTPWIGCWEVDAGGGGGTAARYLTLLGVG